MRIDRFIIFLGVFLIILGLFWDSRKGKWDGLDNSELAQVVECLPPESELWTSADQELERRKGH